MTSQVAVMSLTAKEAIMSLKSNGIGKQDRSGLHTFNTAQGRRIRIEVTHDARLTLY